MSTQDPREFTLSAGDAAGRLGVSRDAVSKWARDGRIPCLTTPGGYRRFRPVDVDTFAEEMLKGAAS
jgi:excisionase family DNA binding protein